LTQIWFYPIIGNAWGSPTANQVIEGDAVPGPEHKWIACSTDWIALCDPETRTPPLKFQKHLPQLGLWSEPNRNIADACEACREINDKGWLTEKIGERSPFGADTEEMIRYPPRAGDQHKLIGIG